MVVGLSPTRVGENKMTIAALPRTEDFGSAGSRRLIKKGLFPAEMYGKGQNFHIVLNAHDFEFALRKIKEGDKVEVALEGKVYNCIFKELQENIMTGTLVHADFQIV